VQGDIEQATLPFGKDRGDAADGGRIEHAPAHDPQPARPFRDQDVAIGQESHSPGMLEAGNDLRQHEGRLLG
jgi:hypothetical protein